ncbi:hypothetical protein CVT26_008915 [Gymnopilus dilepis]|uniref:Uncharacterized protein n=1 Tax=Gymnopilus dilepis TaxID=231916 RepID=A0A409YRV7_9AGAR|nr:hypothetical protein CVT26_008915 [Gymnopilus dilepis]
MEKTVHFVSASNRLDGRVKLTGRNFTYQDYVNILEHDDSEVQSSTAPPATSDPADSVQVQSWCNQIVEADRSGRESKASSILKIQQIIADAGPTVWGGIALTLTASSQEFILSSQTSGPESDWALWSSSPEPRPRSYCQVPLRLRHRLVAV